MKTIREMSWGRKLFIGAASLMLVLMLGMLLNPFPMVTHAQSQGRVIATSAKIRKEANTSSEVLGSAEQNASLTINNQVTGSDNAVWYQVFVNAETLGYIRADLVEITDGTTPPVATETTTNTANTTPTDTTPTANTQTPVDETPAEVSAVEPISAEVIGGQSVRVRSNASTASQVVTIVQTGLALTVNGQANGTDGKVWYQVSFISENKDVTGFIRSDYVQLSGELVPAGEGTQAPEEGAEPEETVPEEPVVAKDWDTQYTEDLWYLINNVTEKRYKIDQLFEVADSYQTLYDTSLNDQSKNKTLTIVVIILVIFVVGMAGFITVLIFKIKDISDSAYFSEVEKETIRRRDNDRASAGGKVMQTVGAEKRTQGPRPAGARPAGAPSQGQRPAGARPTGARPTGAPSQGQRPAGARPAGTPSQGQRPAGARPTGTSPAKAPITAEKTQNSGWKSKNFMTDDDEFEFEFLNWDGEDE